MKYYKHCNIAQYLIAVQGYILGLKRYMPVLQLVDNGNAILQLL